VRTLGSGKEARLPCTASVTTSKTTRFTTIYKYIPFEPSDLERRLPCIKKKEKKKGEK
jgi:hypothetical protein